MPRLQIDRRVRKLVNTLNSVPGVHTSSSCGGHTRPTGGQEASGEFYVGFEIERSSNGWDALAVITHAVDEAEFSQFGNIEDRFRIFPWTQGCPNTLAFEVHGKEYADPDVLAEIIQRSADNG